MIPTIQVDATKAFAKFSDAGIPESVRRNLRSMLPPLGKAVGASVDAKLDTQLKSRTTLTTNQEMREPTSGRSITMRVWVTSPTGGGLLPRWIEEGTKGHGPVEAPFLVFQIDGEWIRTKFVKGMFGGDMQGLHYMENTLAEMESEIVDTLTQAVRQGAQEANG